MTVAVGANAHLKIPGIVAGMLAGADSIDDLDVLRHGGMGELFGGVRAPSTLGSFLARVRLGQRAPARGGVAAAARRAAPRVTPGAGRRRGDGASGHRLHAAPRLRPRRRREPGSGRPRSAGTRCSCVGSTRCSRRCPTPTIVRRVLVGTRAARRDRELGPRRRLLRGRVDHHRPPSWGHRAADRPDGLRVLQRCHHRRVPPQQRAVLGHRPDGQKDHQGDRRDPRTRLDPHPLPQRDLRRGRTTLDLRRRGRRDRLHRVHQQQEASGDRPADRAAGPPPGPTHPGCSLSPRLAPPRDLHRQPAADARRRDRPPRPRHHRAGDRRPRRTARSRTCRPAISLRMPPG